MKPSFKLLGAVYLAYIVVSIITILSLRHSVAVDWERSDEILSAHTRYVETDSIQLEAPPPDIKWYDITLGINTRLPKDEWDQSEHIFSDLGLILVHAYPTTLTRYPYPDIEPTSSVDMWKRFLPNKLDWEVRKYLRRNSGTLSFTFALDSLFWPNQKRPWRQNIGITIIKESELPKENYTRLKKDTTWTHEPLNTTFHIKRYNQISTSGRYYATHTVYYRDSVKKHSLSFFCSWYKGLWKTEINMYFGGLGDLDRNLKFRDQIRDRLFDYYRELNNKNTNS